MLAFLLASSIHIANSLIQQQATLNAQTCIQNDASIQYNPRSVTTSGTNFEITVQSEPYDAYDLKLSLRKPWGFHPSITSSITLTLNGYTYSPQTDTDMLIVFSIANKQYFSLFFHLDNHMHHPIRICPSLYSTSLNVSEWISDTMTHPNRYNRLCNESADGTDNWIYTNYNRQTLWPFKFILTNYPNKQYSVFEFYHDLSSQFVIDYEFDTLFIPNKPMDIYIMGDWKNEHFAVSTIHVLSDNIPTTNPTVSPSVNPSIQPIKIPTANPIAIPTISPTIIPTIIPTLLPSINAIISSETLSNSPTISPTNMPTMIPSLNPTTNPTTPPLIAPSSVNPTLIPTIIPTVNPTAMPTEIPTEIPTVNPSAMPAGIPTVEPTIYSTFQPTALHIPTTTNVKTTSDTINLSTLDSTNLTIHFTATQDTEPINIAITNDNKDKMYIYVLWIIGFVALLAIIIRLYMWYKKRRNAYKIDKHVIAQMFEQISTNSSLSDVSHVESPNRKRTKSSSSDLMNVINEDTPIITPIFERSNSKSKTLEIKQRLDQIQQEINAELKQHRIITIPELNSSSDEDMYDESIPSYVSASDNGFYAELSALYNPNRPVINIYANDIEESEEDDLTIVRKRTLSIVDPIAPAQSAQIKTPRYSQTQVTLTQYSQTQLKTRRYSQSHSVLPVNSVFKLRIKENVTLQNEFDLFRLLLSDMQLLIDALNTFNIETFVNFLPLILFKASKCEKHILNSKVNYILILISELSKIERLLENDDITQKLHFMTNCFKNTKGEQSNCEKIKGLVDNAYKIWLQNCTKYNSSKTNDNVKDLTKFWETVLQLDENDTKTIKYCDKSSFYIRDPVQPNELPLREIKVCKQFQSATKPILCELWVGNDRNNNGFEWDVTSHIILKKGDDLRKDYAITCIFKYMNYIWKSERDDMNSEFNYLSYESSIVKILTFDVVPMSNDFGGIELISNCVPLRHVESLKDELEKEHIYQLITSAAASYIGAFVCGVRDRHNENILIRVADATLFHIDFGYCVGETIKFAIDASPFGITNTLKDLMNCGETNQDLYIEKFIPICVDAYMALRKHYKSLIKFAQLAFSYIKKESDIENFIKHRLKIFDDKRHKKWNNKWYVEEWLKKELITAPKDVKTIRKNKLRKLLSPSSTAKTPGNRLSDDFEI